MSDKILFVGDLHGSMYDLEQAIRRARKHGAHIIQVGDFGYLWPGGSLDAEVDRLTQEAGVRLAFIDGNHDWHDKLPGRWPAPELGKDFKYHDPGCYYVPRGHSFTVGNFSVVGLGGAPSIDRKFRELSGRKWWPTEEITYAQAQGAIASGTLGVAETTILVTHDAPRCPDKIGPLKYGPWADTAEWFEPLAANSTSLIREVMERIRPTLHVHGHYHVAYSETWPTGTTLVGLSNNGTPGSTWLVELDGDEWWALDSTPE